MLQTDVPFRQYFDIDGKPLNGGSIYFGQPNQNPETAPIAVYWDSAGTQPAAQPISTVNGYSVRRGSPAGVFVDGEYSVTVRDRKGALVYYAPTSANFDFSTAFTAFLAALAATPGSAYVGFTQDGAGAVLQTVQAELRARAVTPQQFKLDSDADWTAALIKMFATGKAWYIPDKAAGYTVSAPLTVNASGICDGYLLPTDDVGENPTVIIASGGFEKRRFVAGLRVQGSVAVRAAGVDGIRVDCEHAHLVNCQGQQLDYGVIVRNYSVTLDKCHFYQCNTNLSAYARDFTHEINALNIIGGSYDSAVNCAMNIGDASWPDAIAAGSVHGVGIYIGGEVAIDGSEIRIDNVYGVKLGSFYCEGSNTGNAIRLGGHAEGSVRDVDIEKGFFKNLDYAVRCYSGVNGLRLGPSFYTDVKKSALYVTSDLYPFTYEQGTSTASFTLGREVHTGFRFLAPADINFANATIPHEGLYRGVQTLSQSVGVLYPGGQIRASLLTKTESAGTNFRRYTAPQTGIAGTVAGTAFTFAAPEHSASFNGGDQVVLSLGGASYIRYVDYDAGIAQLDGSVGGGAATISQVTASLRTEVFGTAPPTTGNWFTGDRVINIAPSIGSPKAWVCTFTGTPGTWVSEGNL